MSSLVVFVAKYFFAISVVVVALYWLKASRPVKFDLAWQLIVGGFVAVLLAVIGGHLFYDTRPFVSHHLKPLIAHAPDNGFPSDHTLLTAFLGFSILRYSRRVGLILLAIAVMVGAARVAAHIHSPIDIIGSFVIGAIAVFVAQVVVAKGLKSWMASRRGIRD